jgi:hypothetical protein
MVLSVSYFISRTSSSPTGTCVLPYLNAFMMFCKYETAEITIHSNSSRILTSRRR